MENIFSEEVVQENNYDIISIEEIYQLMKEEQDKVKSILNVRFKYYF